MERLLTILKGIENGTVELKTIVFESRKVGIICDEAEYIACNLLITEAGRCDWTNIKILEENGFKVYAGDQDSYGWLTGIIKTSKGEIVYG